MPMINLSKDSSWRFAIGIGKDYPGGNVRAAATNAFPITEMKKNVWQDKFD